MIFFNDALKYTLMHLQDSEKGGLFQYKNSTAIQLTFLSSKNQKGNNCFAKKFVDWLK